MEYSEDKNRAAKLSYEGWFEDDSENEDSRDSEAYSTEDFISGPIRVEGGTVPHDILEFHTYIVVIISLLSTCDSCAICWAFLLNLSCLKGKASVRHFRRSLTHSFLGFLLAAVLTTFPSDVYTSHSYAYDCQRFFNLCVVDPDTVVFASGNVIHFFNATRATMTFRRCSTGGGIGHITKNPSENHIAVGENGTDPPIIIYEWPSMRIVTVLRGGTTRSYLHLAYSSDGRLLVSQGGEPDYMTTVWNWKRSKILLHCTSHSQDIYNAMFSPTVLGHLTTSGAGHIKFWKMARTFTGLKLQGEFGKFGKTEISDIVGFYPMPDEKVVSGCEWGNILLWDEELIKLEIAKKNRKPCHDKYITQFEYLGGELVSIGMDGWIRVWYYETIDLADPPDEDRFLENEPIYEFQIKEEDSENGAMLVSMKKQHPDDPEENLWYAQDGNGGMWLVELGTYGELKRSPRKLLTCHAGPITCMCVSTWGPFVATCGRDGHLHIYNYSTKRLIFVKRFRDRASWLVWFPCSVEATGSTLACAFESGVVRIVTLAISKADETDNIYGDYLRLIKTIKPHKLAITAMSLNPTNRLLVTGSEDCTIFVFAVKVTETYPDLVPIGYVKLFSGVSCMTWNPELSNTILVGCLRGDCAQVELPDQPQDYTKVTYELVGCEACCFKFQSVKSKIRRELARLEIAKAKEARRAVQREKMKKLQMDNPSIAIEEEEILADMDDDPPLPELYVPEVPNRVLIAKYSMAGTIWLSMGGYDAGYIYEYPIPEAARSNLPIEPIRSTMVIDADDTEISSCLYYHKYVFLGMQRGEIRVCRVNPNDHSDFSDYLVLSMHDNRNGFIPVMSLSHDERMLLTCGHDGNLFSYNINDEDPHVDVRIDKPKPPLHLVIARKIHNRPIEIACRINYVTNDKIQKPNSNVDDIEELDHLTLEEVIVKTENDRIAAAATLKRDATLELLAHLTEEFGSIIERNSNLPKTQQIPQEEFALDPRITTDLNNHLKAEMDLMHQKLAFDVEKSRLGLEKLLEHFIEPITCLPFAVCKISEPSAMVHSLRERKLGDHFTSTYNDVLRRIEEKNKASRMLDDKNLETVEEEEEMEKVQEMESFLKDLKPETVEYRLGIQINQMLRKYKTRKEKMEERAKEWKILYASKPNPDANHPDDILAIQRAKDTIGDYKLKVSPDFRQSQEERETTLMKYKQLLDCRKKTHHLREDFQSRLRALRDKKLALQAEVQSLIEKLKQIHAELPDKEIKPLPVVLEIDRNVEFPEKNLELEEYVSMAERVKATKRKKMSISEEIIINPMDEEYEVLLLDEKLIESERVALLKDLEATRPEKVFKARVSVPSEILKSLSANDRAGTPWERQMKRMRVTRKIHEQDTILEHVRQSYRDLDEKLNQLERERLRITADSAYSDLFLLTLHQQLIILKDFESMENHLMKKVTEKKAERERANQKVQATNAKIDQRNKEIVKMQEKIKNLQSQFNRMTSDNKFGDFLRRIYKKKNKPLKNKDDKSSSASSTESSTDDDEESVASDDLAPLYLHESICPIGCDQKLYEFAFSTREERYECENYANEARKAIELLRKESDGDSKKLKLIDNELTINQKDLEDFMSEKQRKLDDIDMTVILKFHQLQHFIDENNVAEIRDCVVFDKTKLSQLYTRVGELRQETYAQKEKHNKNRTHLHRMKIDCKHMEAEITSLKTKIQQEMIQKFGREVSLDALYEAVLRKMIHDVKSDMRQISKEFDEQIKSVKEKYHEQIDVLQTLVQDNTEKLRFFTTLEAEQTKLKKILRHAPESEEKMSNMEAEYKMDLEHLESTLKNLRQQKALFRNDIRNLRLKTRPLPPICAAKRSEQLPKIVKTTNDSAASSLDLLDLQFEKELKTVELTSCDSEDSQQIEDNENSNDHSNIVEDKEEDEEYSLTATMVHQRLSKGTEESVEDEETTGVTREMLKQVLRNVPIGGGPTEISEGIERSVDQIIASLDQEDDETIEAMKEAVRESLHEVVQRFEEESRSIGRSSGEIGWNIKQKIIDLSENIGLQYDIKVEQVVMKLLKTHDGIETAWDYLSQNVRKISDPETVMALREHAFRTLGEIKEEIENAEEAAAQVKSRKKTALGEKIVYRPNYREKKY